MQYNFNYSDNEYHTKPNAHRFIWDRLVLGTRAFFFMRMFHLVRSFNGIIRRGGFSNESWCDASYYGMESVEGCGGRLHFLGINKILSVDGPCVFIGNHMSTLETFLLPGIICPKKPSSFVVKTALIEMPLFGTIMKATMPIVVGRVNPVEDFKVVINEGCELIRSGRSVIVFPQSTRGSIFDPEKFNSIGVKLAKKAGVPIIPIALKTDFWDNGKWIKDIGPVHRELDVYIEFGDAINVSGAGKEEHQQIVSFIKNRLNKWGGQVQNYD